MAYYIVVVAQHPQDDDEKMIVSTTPEQYIRIKPNTGNIVSFEPEGVGVDGFLVLKREMPEDRKLNVRIYLRHSRKPARNAGVFL